MRLEIAEQISRLMEAFGSSAAVVSDGLLTDMIRIADAYPASLVARVVDKYRLGLIEGQSLEFPPKLPQWASVLRAEMRRPGEPGYVSPEQHRQRQIEQQRVEPLHHDEGKKARIRAILEQFRADRMPPADDGRTQA